MGDTPALIVEGYELVQAAVRSRRSQEGLLGTIGSLQDRTRQLGKEADLTVLVGLGGHSPDSVPLERWASQEALAAHDATPHMIEADAASPAFRAGPADVIPLVADPLA